MAGLCLSSPESQHNIITAADCSKVRPHYWQYQFWKTLKLVDILWNKSFVRVIYLTSFFTCNLTMQYLQHDGVLLSPFEDYTPSIPSPPEHRGQDHLPP